MFSVLSRIDRRIKRRKLLLSLLSVGRNFSFDANSSILSPETIRIGDNVFVGEMAHFTGEITIGNNVMFGPRPVIITGDHYFAVRGKSVRFLHPQGRETYEPVTVEDESWCGACVVILGGVTLGMGCVIGAGSVVTKSIPPYVVAVGNHCRPIKKVFDDEALSQHVHQLTDDVELAKRIVERRNTELANWKCGELACVDKTSIYWETAK